MLTIYCHKKNYFKPFVVGFIIALGVLFFFRYPSVSEDYAHNLGIQVYSSPEKPKDFSLRDINNKLLRLSDFKGKTVMLNFWATWCGPCIKEMPSMEQLYRRFKDKGFIIISIASGENKESVTSFIEKINITFPALLDTDLKVTDSYNVWALPTTYFIDKKGKIIGKVYGSRDWTTPAANKYIVSILEESSPD